MAVHVYKKSFSYTLEIGDLQVSSNISIKITKGKKKKLVTQPEFSELVSSATK